MLPDLTFLLAVLLGLGLFGPGDYDPLLAFGGTAALTAIAVALTTMSAERSIRTLAEEGGIAQAQARLSLLPLTPLLAWFVSLETLHFGAAVYDLLPATTWLLRHVLLFIPPLIAFSAAWAARARVEGALSARLGLQVPQVTTAQAIRTGLRRNGLALIPLGVVLGLVEGLSLAADLGVPGCAVARAALEDVPQLRVAFELALLGLLALVLPWLLARIISSEPFPAGAQRLRLEQLASALKLRYREMRLWKTGGRGLNAMVVGLTPGTRRIFVTDGLLRALPPHEVEAVFCHEAGHALRHHLLWFLGVAGLLSLAFLVLDEPLARLGLGEGMLRSLLHLGLLWFVVLGSLSRHFERESDVDGGEHAALLDPEAPPLSLPGLATPLPAGATRMIGALKRIEALMGDVYSHRHGRPSERAAYVAYHVTQQPARAEFQRRSRGLRLGILVVGGLLLAVSLARLPDDLELARADAALRSAHEAHERAFDLARERPAEAVEAWKEAQAEYLRAAQGLTESPRMRAQRALPLAWLGLGDTALRGAGDLAAARLGFTRAIEGALAATQPGPWRRVVFEARVDLGLVALREGKPEEAADLLALVERQIWSNEGAGGSHARARLRLLAGALDLARGQTERGTRTLRDLAALSDDADDWVELRRDALAELSRHGIAPR